MDVIVSYGGLNFTQIIIAITAAITAIGAALVTSYSTLKAVKITQDVTDKREEQKRQDEHVHVRREERKLAYSRFIGSLYALKSASNTNRDDISKDLMLASAEIMLVGHENVRTKVADFFNGIDAQDLTLDNVPGYIIKLADEVLPLMRLDLQEEIN